MASPTHLVDVDNAALCADEILPRLQIQLVKDRFDVIADVSRLREARRVRDHQRHIDLFPRTAHE